MRWQPEPSQASVSANGYSIPSTGIKYRAYSDEAGWSAWKTNGAAAGDTSKTYNMKAVEMQWNTTSAENAYYDLYYRVYVPGRGWAWLGQECTDGRRLYEGKLYFRDGGCDSAEDKVFISVYYSK